MYVANKKIGGSSSGKQEKHIPETLQPCGVQHITALNEEEYFVVTFALIYKQMKIIYIYHNRSNHLNL